MLDVDKEPPLVSFLMSVFNAEEYLGECLDSLLGQTYPNFELIVIDDCSSDTSASTIAAYQRNDARIKLVTNEKNLGNPQSLNAGLAYCSGKYIARMDSDDISVPERLEKQVQFMEGNPDVGLCGAAVRYFGESEGIRVFEENDTELRLQLLTGNPFAHPSVIIRREVLTKHNLLYRANYKAAEDYLLWVQISEVAKIHNLPDVLLNYRVHKSQLTRTHAETQTKEKDETLDYIYTRVGFDLSKYHWSEAIKLFNREYTLSFDTLSRSNELLVHLLQKNMETHYLPHGALVEKVFSVWKGMTWGSSRLGLKFFLLFYRSPLSCWTTLTIAFRVKFFIKCLIKR